MRLVFVEEWESREALAVHFQVRGSQDFAAAVGRLAAEPPSLEVFEATPIVLDVLASPSPRSTANSVVSVDPTLTMIMPPRVSERHYAHFFERKIMSAEPYARDSRDETVSVAPTLMTNPETKYA